MANVGDTPHKLMGQDTVKVSPLWWSSSDSESEQDVPEENELKKKIQALLCLCCNSREPNWTRVFLWCVNDDDNVTNLEKRKLSTIYSVTDLFQ